MPEGVVSPRVRRRNAAVRRSIRILAAPLDPHPCTPRFAPRTGRSVVGRRRGCRTRAARAVEFLHASSAEARTCVESPSPESPKPAGERTGSPPQRALRSSRLEVGRAPERFPRPRRSPPAGVGFDAGPPRARRAPFSARRPRDVGPGQAVPRAALGARRPGGWRSRRRPRRRSSSNWRRGGRRRGRGRTRRSSASCGSPWIEAGRAEPAATDVERAPGLRGPGREFDPQFSGPPAVC